jgi:hypothetical protein
VERETRRKPRSAELDAAEALEAELAAAELEDDGLVDDE